MEYKTRKYPLFSACGLNCGLCPNFHIHTSGKFRCPGCVGEGFSEVHPSCGIFTCNQKKDIEYCIECDDFPCNKYDGWGDSDSFITHRNFRTDMEKAKIIGIDAYIAEQNEKVGILSELLEKYNDGRRKTFYCLAVNLLELEDINTVMDQITVEIKPEASLKEKTSAVVRLFEVMAAKRNILLKKQKK